MSISQFFRILWARRGLIGSATLACLLGAIAILVLVPARWEAQSRVMLNILKPDPVTGQVISGPATRAYVATQTELITDYSVAGQVVDQLGWLSDPRLIAQYRARPKRDVRDFRRYLADIVIKATKAQLVEGSNILEITYTSDNPGNAKVLADAVRKAYMDASLAYRRDEATRNAAWYQEQTDKARFALDTALATEAEYERRYGIVMQDDKVDVESARLRSLSAQGTALGPMVTQAPQTSPATLQLAQIDAEISQAQQTLGPNHPQLQALRSRRAAIQAIVTKEQTSKAEQVTAAHAAAASAAALQNAVQAQKQRVMAERDKLGKLNELQTDVDQKRDQYNKTSARLAELRQEAAVADSGITPMGNAATPKDPKFPNVPLIVGGALFLGLGMGVCVALLAELLGRRVRSLEDLKIAVNLPVLAAVAPLGQVKRKVKVARPSTAGGFAKPKSASA